MPTSSFTDPYARLYRAVIFRAVQDLAHKQYRDEARNWLLSPESDYAFAVAGISADSVRRRLASAGGNSRDPRDTTPYPGIASPATRHQELLVEATYM